MRQTGRNLDFAIQGEGYFVVSDGDREYYTRNGAFKLQPDGSVVNSIGMKLQGLTGDLRLPVGTNISSLRLDDLRNIQVDGNTIGRVKLVQATPEELQSAGNTLFTTGTPLKTEGTGSVMSGYLEQSNSIIVEEMVTMMTTLRNYESCQKMLKTNDDVTEKMLTKLLG